MKCPVCKTNDLLMSDRQGVEIDYCPECRGVWLDRGELDKIIERALPSAAPQPSSGSEQRFKKQDQEHDGRHGSGHGYGKPYKKKSFLEDIFDF